MPKLINILGQRPTYSGSDVWHWPLDEGTGTTAAERINAVNLTIANGGWGTNDSINGMQDALAFNGTSTEVYKTSTVLGMGTGSFSIAFWLYSSRTTTSIGGIFSNKGGAGVPGYLCWLADKLLTFRLYDDDTTVSWLYSAQIPLSTWTHVAWTVNRTTTNTPGKLYINGLLNETLAQDTASLGSITPATANIVVGSNLGYLQGKLSDMWLFRNKVLTANEVLELYKYLGD